jgi:hypothetical protein
MFKVAQQEVVDFELIDKLDNAQKTATAKQIAFIVHKNAIPFIVPAKPIFTQVLQPKAQVLYELIVPLGFARGKMFPIVEVVLK